MSLILVLRNTSSLAEVSDYEYTVMVGDGTKERSKVLESGVVKGHHRSNGWMSLINRFINKRTPKKIEGDMAYEVWCPEQSEL